MSSRSDSPGGRAEARPARVDFDENWVVLGDRSASEIVERLGGDIAAESRGTLTSVLEALIGLARETGIAQAAVMLPDPPIDSVVAYAECRWYDGAGTGLVGTAGQVHKALSSGAARLPDHWRLAGGLGDATSARRGTGPPQLDWQDIARVTLPAGDAVRIRDLDIQTEPVEMVAYLVPIPDRQGGVAVIMSWARLHGMRPFGGEVHSHLYDSEAPDSSRGLTLHADSLAESLQLGG